MFIVLIKMLFMITKTQKFIVSFPVVRAKTPPQVSFFELAKKNIVKSKKLGAKNLSKNIDKIAYGI